MLWLVVIVLLALQIVCRAFGAKRYRMIMQAREQKRRRREFRALYRLD